MQGFAAGTFVTTSRGCIPIEQVRAGDMVLTHTNRYCPVLSSEAFEYRDLMLQIRAPFGLATLCTKKQAFLARGRVTKVGRNDSKILTEGKTQWIDADRILARLLYKSKQKRVRHRIIHVSSLIDNTFINPSEILPHIDNERIRNLFSEDEFWYLLTRYAFEGRTLVNSKGEAVVQFSSRRDLTALCQILDNLGVSHVSSLKSHSDGVIVTDSSISNFIGNYLGRNRERRHDSLPAEMMMLPQGPTDSIYRAILDCRGEIVDANKAAERYKVRVYNKGLVYTIAHIISKSTYRPCGISYLSQKEHYIVDWRVSDTIQERCNVSYRRGNYLWGAVREIDLQAPSKPQTMYELTVDLDHSHLANGCIVRSA